ncbi:MAG: hypothetical protein GXO15_05400, partial [Crenarchaeota archaeon]|nr:hypothetical protein [Thermoproteota archaeon]
MMGVKVARPDYDAVRRFVEKLLEDPSAESKVLREAALGALEYSEDVKRWLGWALEAARGVVGEVARGYADAGYLAVRLYYRLVTPGLVGAGGGLLKPVFEVGLSIHPLLGLPYYPGSGLKGAVRALAEVVLGEEAAAAVFGYTGGEGGGLAGAVVFEDMLPVGCFERGCSVYRGLVIAPHYHRDGRPVPVELLAVPQPVPHLGVEEGLVFGLVYAVHPVRARIALERLGGSVGGACGGGDGQGVYGGLCEQVRGLLSSSRRPEERLAALVFVLTNAVLSQGIAARSTKGYNVFELLEGEP